MKSKIIVLVNEDFFVLSNEYVKRKYDEFVSLKHDLIRRDLKNIEIFGHKIAGSAANYGFEELGKLGKKMELACIDNNVDECKQCFAKIEDYFSKIEIQIKEVS